MQPSLVTDGLLLSLIAALYLGFLSARVLRRAPRSTGLALLGIVVLGTVLRVLIAREAILTAWTYTRIVPLAKAISDGVLFDWLTRHFDHQVYLTDLIFKTNLVLASLTPLPLFLHASFLLKDFRSALVAAAIFAVLPIHITFSRSDVYFIQSLFFSSLAFATLYSALSDPSKTWRLISLGFLGPLLFTVFLARPLNLIFCPLLLVTAFVTVGRDVLMVRRWIAAFVITVPAVLDLGLNLLVGYGEQVHEGLGMRTLVQAWNMLFDLQRNTVINPSITPVVIPALMVLGLYTLWRSGRSSIAIYLFGWLAAFFVTHAFIVPFRPTMMARYHLHLVSPVVLMAAAAAPTILDRPRWVAAALALYLLACPLIHIGFERGVDFSIQREFEFLTSLRDRVPTDCTIIEYAGPAGCERAPRVHRVASYAGSARTQRWRNFSLVGPPRTHNVERTPLRGSIGIADLDEIVAREPCVMFYEGNLCRSYGTSWDDLAPACKEVHRRFELEPAASTHYREHIYDPADARGDCGGTNRDFDFTTIARARLTLYRIRTVDR